MKLPNGDHAVIDPRKVTEYCLNPDHDDGKHKAHLFNELVGVTLDNAHLLLDSLANAAIGDNAIEAKKDKYGQRFIIDFEFDGPVGNASIRSVWIVRNGEANPRLVTCYIL